MNDNTGHGHVWDRPDGFKARCGGPGLCGECSDDRAKVNAAVSQFAAKRKSKLPSLTHNELLRFGLCVSTNNRTIDLFDMAKFKAAMSKPGHNTDIVDNWTVFPVAEVTNISPECLKVVLASLHMYQCVTRLAIQVQEADQLLLASQFTKLRKHFKEMIDVCGLSQRIALEGAEEVAESMPVVDDNSLTRLDEPFK